MNLLKAIIVLQVFFTLKSYSQEETCITVQVQFLSKVGTVNNLPVVIANSNDTLQLDKRYNNYSEHDKFYAFKYSGEYNSEKKASFEIYHPDYPLLTVDSVNLSTDIRLKMLHQDEQYYISNGIKTSLNFERKYVAIKFEENCNIDSLLIMLNEKYNLLIAADFRDSIKTDDNGTTINTKDGYGGIEDVLTSTFWFERKDGKLFQNVDSKYCEIRNVAQVEYLSVPQSFSENITNGFIIYLKKDINPQELDKLIAKYSLMKDMYYDTYLKYHPNEHHFISNDLLPNNQMMINLMKENIVKTAVLKEIGYEINCEK